MALDLEAGKDPSLYSGRTLYHCFASRGYLVVKEVAGHHIRQLHVQVALPAHHYSVSRGCPAAPVPQALHSRQPPV